MEIDVNIRNVEEFVLSDDFREFLMSKTTSFATAAFVLQTLLNKIEEIKSELAEQEYKNRNIDKEGKWEINSDGYYPTCPFCGEEPQEKVILPQCPNCGAILWR